MRGILINNAVHTGRDLNLVMTGKSLPPPKAQTYAVEVPGHNGVLDLSEFITGETTYSNRILTFNFVGDGSRETVLNLIERMCEYHGKSIVITTDDYLDWYYSGRAEVDYVDHGYYVEFTLMVDAFPFRLAINPKVYDFGVCEAQTITVLNEGRPVIPTISVTGEATIVKNGVTVTISDGTYEDEFFKLIKGDNEFTLTSTGTVTITYREAVI